MTGSGGTDDLTARVDDDSSVGTTAAPATDRRGFLRLTGTALATAGVASLGGCLGQSGGDYDRSQADFDPPVLPYDETYPAGVDISMFRRGLRRLGYYPDATVPDAVAVDWQLPVNYIGHTAAKSSPRPTPEGDAIVVAGDTGHVHSVTTMGKHRWTTLTEATHLGIHSTPTIVDGVAYVGGYDGDLYALDVDTGEMVWQLSHVTIGGATAIGASPAYWDGVLYFVAEYLDPKTGVMWAVDAATGTPLWSDDRPDGMPHPSPAIDFQAERLVIGSNDGVVYAWEFPSMEFAWSFETDGQVKGTPPVYEGKTYVGSWDGNFYCLDLAEGEEQWRFETPEIIMCNPGIDPENDTVIFGGDDWLVHAVDAHTGELRWETTVKGNVLGSITVTDNAVLVGSYDTNLYALEKTTGDVMWTVENNGYVTSEPVPHDGNIYYAERAQIENYWTDQEPAEFQKPGHAYRVSGTE